MMITIRAFAPEDAEAVSAVIRTTMRISNSHDYPIAQLQPLIDYFSPAKVLLLSAERHCLVATIDGRVVGTAALEGHELLTFFVLPDVQGRGVGALLLAGLEAHARAAGLRELTVDASITGAPFYARHGYQETGVTHAGSAGPQIGMVKRLSSPEGDDSPISGSPP
jgi:GNAT superfamily N-acetyltransferase